VSVSSLLVSGRQAGVEGTSRGIGSGTAELQGTQITVSNLGVPSPQAQQPLVGG
jgi:hypothetical protein